MKFLDDKNFKIISLCLNALTLLLVFSIKMNTCTLSNDLRTTKKVTKSLNETAKDLKENVATKGDLQKQTKEYLIKEKQLDQKNSDLDKILNDTIQ